MIVILYPQCSGVGGIARYIDSFLSNLPTTAPEIVLITGERPADFKGYPGVETLHIPMTKNRLGLLLWSWKARRRLAALNRQRPVTVVNLHIPPLIPGLFLTGDFPIVLTAHTTYLGMSGKFDGNRNFRSPWGALTLWLKTLMERVVIGRADMVISLTEQGRQELTAYGRRDQIAIVPNGVDIAEFTSKRGTEKDIDLIFSGRIERRKGSRPMVEVCQRLVVAYPEIRIAIVGYGDDYEFVRQALATHPDNIRLYGKVPFSEMVGYYRRSKVYVSTSYYEGLPGTCLEAMATGLPVVVWDLLFYRDLVVDGVTGLSAPTNDHAAMVRCIGRLLETPELANELGHRARAIARERYDWQRLSRQLLGVYSQVLRQPSPVQVTS